MNDRTAELIEQLAQQLGTTSEYIWSVLVAQAPISASITLFYCFVTIVLGIILYRFHLRFSKETEDKESIYDEYEGFVILPMVIGVIIWIGIFIAVISSIGNIITGFFHPEYWALDQILKLVK